MLGYLTPPRPISMHLPASITLLASSVAKALNTSVPGLVTVGKSYRHLKTYVGGVSFESFMPFTFYKKANSNEEPVLSPEGIIEDDSDRDDEGSLLINAPHSQNDNAVSEDDRTFGTYKDDVVRIEGKIRNYYQKYPEQPAENEALSSEAFGFLVLMLLACLAPGLSAIKRVPQVYPELNLENKDFISFGWPSLQEAEGWGYFINTVIFTAFFVTFFTKLFTNKYEAGITQHVKKMTSLYRTIWNDWLPTVHGTDTARKFFLPLTFTAKSAIFLLMALPAIGLKPLYDVVIGAEPCGDTRMVGGMAISGEPNSVWDWVKNFNEHIKENEKWLAAKDISFGVKKLLGLGLSTLYWSMNLSAALTTTSLGLTAFRDWNYTDSFMPPFLFSLGVFTVLGLFFSGISSAAIGIENLTLAFIDKILYLLPRRIIDAVPNLHSTNRVLAMRNKVAQEKIEMAERCLGGWLEEIARLRGEFNQELDIRAEEAYSMADRLIAIVVPNLNKMIKRSSGTGLASEYIFDKQKIAEILQWIVVHRTRQAHPTFLRQLAGRIVWLIYSIATVFAFSYSKFWSMIAGAVFTLAGIGFWTYITGLDTLGTALFYTVLALGTMSGFAIYAIYQMCTSLGFNFLLGSLQSLWGQVTYVAQKWETMANKRIGQLFLIDISAFLAVIFVWKVLAAPSGAGTAQYIVQTFESAFEVAPEFAQGMLSVYMNFQNKCIHACDAVSFGSRGFSNFLYWLLTLAAPILPGRSQLVTSQQTFIELLSRWVGNWTGLTFAGAGLALWPYAKPCVTQTLTSGAQAVRACTQPARDWYASQGSLFATGREGQRSQASTTESDRLVLAHVSPYN